MGMPMTPLLRQWQSYFFSSFDAPLEEISAACGWNFVAAEEGGRWVSQVEFTMVYEFWRRLKQREDVPGMPPALSKWRLPGLTCARERACK
jgi:hypothetical protein